MPADSEEDESAATDGDPTGSASEDADEVPDAAAAEDGATATAATGDDEATEGAAEAVTDEATGEEMSEAVTTDVTATDEATDGVADVSSEAIEPELEGAADAAPVARQGATTVADEVIEKVATIAARRVTGVHDLGSDAGRVLGVSDDSEAAAGKGIAVRLDGETATIGVTLVVAYGNRVYDVANQVRQDVADTVESMLGVDVVAVDIVVEDVHIPDA